MLQAMADPLARSRMECFATAGMRMDGAGDVLQPGTHLQRQPEAGREFGDAVTDRLNAQHEVVVGPGDDADEALLGILRQGPAIRSEGELPEPDVVPRLACFRWGKPDRDDLRAGEADGGDGLLVEDAAGAGRAFRPNLPLG